jgi:radical SAM superfamily enzyme YgiQ (UPF0313 family)
MLINPISVDEAPVIRIGRCQTKVQPGIGIWPPMDLALIGGTLKKIDGVSDVWLYDAQIDGSYSFMMKRIIEYKPSIIILNCTTPTFRNDIHLINIIKATFENVFVIFFGLHATVKYEEIMSTGLVDCCVLKEPEYTIYLICESYLQRGKDDLRNINNIVIHLDGCNIITYQRNEGNPVFLNCIPDRSLIENHRYKLSFHNRVFTIVQTSRGCKNHCTYCTSSILTPKYYSRSVESVLDEITIITSKFNIQDIMFLSDTFTADKTWVVEFCKKIIDRRLKIHWMVNSRIDMVDYETAVWMKKAGCWLISLGIESGDQTILQTAGKDIRPIEVRAAVDLLKGVGILTIGYFMFGLPGETAKSISKTIRFSCSLPLDFAYFFLATPFPGTGLYKQAVKNNWLTTSDWDCYSHGENCILQYDNLTADIMTKSMKRAYKAFYLRPIWLVRQLKNMKSVQILLNYIKAGVLVLKGGQV